MYAYPKLTPAEQLTLPRLIDEAEAMQTKFEDSTHQLWHCETVDGPTILKVCDHDVVSTSSFWYGMNELFGANFPNSIGQIHKTHTLLSEKGCFVVPDFLAASASRFVLTRFLAGEDIEAKFVTNEMVVLLAKHIAQLHQQRHQKWGDLHEPAFALADWKEKLLLTLRDLAEKSTFNIPESLLSEVLVQVTRLREVDFVPIMLDLRWDQFRILDSKEAGYPIALIDLDAFAIGPRALELVLLEYVLTAEQFDLFRTQYTLECDWPDYSQQKASYQLLLFLMNVLGETDIQRWMKQDY